MSTIQSLPYSSSAFEFSEQDRQIIVLYNSNFTWMQIASHLHLSSIEVMKRHAELNERNWTDEDLKQLVQIKESGISDQSAAAELLRTTAAIKHKYDEIVRIRNLFMPPVPQSVAPSYAPLLTRPPANNLFVSGKPSKSEVQEISEKLAEVKKDSPLRVRWSGDDQLKLLQYRYRNKTVWRKFTADHFPKRSVAAVKLEHSKLLKKLNAYQATGKKPSPERLSVIKQFLAWAGAGA